jgi:hypothetical protein
MKCLIPYIPSEASLKASRSGQDNPSDIQRERANIKNIKNLVILFSFTGRYKPSFCGFRSTDPLRIRIQNTTPTGHGFPKTTESQNVIGKIEKITKNLGEK